jgi:hypothetical protein
MSLGKDFLNDNAYEIHQGVHPADILSRKIKNNNMSFNLKSITRGKIVRPPRIILLGVEKIGKSSFAAGSNSPIFIPIKGEEGIDDFEVDKFPVCHSLDDIDSALDALLEGGHNYKTVVMDSASTAEPVIWQAVCDENNVASIELAGGGYGKGYGFALDKWRSVTEKLDQLRDEQKMASIIIGHVKVKTFNDPERPSYDQYQFDINEKVAHMLFRWADFIGFANKNIGITEEKGGFNKKVIKGADLDSDTNYLFTKKTPAHPGGGRGIYGKLPSEIPLYWEAFMEEIQALLEPPAPKKKVVKK